MEHSENCERNWIGSAARALARPGQPVWGMIG